MEAARAEVEHMVVGQRADVRPGRGQARQVGRAHPVVDALAGREVPVTGDGCLQIDHPHVRRGVIQDQQRLAPRPAEVDRPGDRPARRLRQVDVGTGVADVCLPQRRVTGVREDLIDAPAEHHVPAEEQGDHTVVHPPTLEPSRAMREGSARRGRHAAVRVRCAGAMWLVNRLRGGPQGGGSSCTGAEAPDGGPLGFGLCPQLAP